MTPQLTAVAGFTALLTVSASSLASGGGLRVVHASPDAPSVDVYVNGTPGVDAPAIMDLPFTAGTGYVDLPTGDYNFKVTPANASMPVVIDADASIDETVYYSVVAIDFLKDITPLVLVDDNRINEDAARVRFVHASPDAPAVDVFAAGVADPLFDAVSFGQSGGYIEVPGGTYDLEVRLDDGGGLALEVPGVTLTAGSVSTIFAMGSVQAGTLQAVPFTDVMGETSFADVRVVHASPDAPPVDVYVNGTPGQDDPPITGLPFTDGTGYIPLMEGPYNFQVTPANSVKPVVIDADAMLEGGTDYSIVAIDFLADIQPLVLVDDRSISLGEARVRFVHASPDAPTVDVFAVGAEDPLFDAVSFGESGGVVAVPAGTYDLEVRLDDGGGLALAVPGVMLEADTAYTIFAMGSVPGGTLQAVPFVDNQLRPDVNDDGVVDIQDLVSVILHWGICAGGADETCPADTDDNGRTDAQDLIGVIMNWD